MVSILRPDIRGGRRSRQTGARTAMFTAGVALTLACGTFGATALAEQQPELFPSSGSALVTLPWGSGEGQVGLLRVNEGLTRGPEALAVAPDGRIAVLDSVNHRLVLLNADAAYERTIAVALAQPRFVAVDDQAIYVLDADLDRRVATYSWSGKTLRPIDLPELKEVVTALFATTAGPCVEIAHGETLVLAAPGNGSSMSVAATGQRGQGRRLAGRPVDNEGREVVTASFRPLEGLRLRKRAASEEQQASMAGEEPLPNLASGREVEHLISIDADGHGGLFVGARLAEPEGGQTSRQSIAITKIIPAAAAAQGGAAAGEHVVEGSVLLLSESDFAYLGQPYVVAPDGRIFQAVANDQGYTILIHVFAEVLP